MQLGEIINGTEYNFIKTDPHLGKHVILLGLAGSYSYGTNLETSDIDIRGITLNRKSDLTGLTQYEQYVDDNTDTRTHSCGDCRMPLQGIPFRRARGSSIFLTP